MRTKVNFLTILFSLLVSAPMALAQESESIIVVLQKDLPDFWVATKKESPHYPLGALNKGKQGCAVIGFVIDSDGTTSSHTVLFSFPDTAFNRAAINAYKKWQFEPAAANKKKEATFTSMTATFTWIEEDAADMDTQMADVCDQEGSKALENLVRNAVQ